MHLNFWFFVLFSGFTWILNIWWTTFSLIHTISNTNKNCRYFNMTGQNIPLSKSSLHSLSKWQFGQWCEVYKVPCALYFLLSYKYQVYREFVMGQKIDVKPFTQPWFLKVGFGLLSICLVPIHCSTAQNMLTNFNLIQYVDIFLPSEKPNKTYWSPFFQKRYSMIYW